MLPKLGKNHTVPSKMSVAPSLNWCDELCDDVTLILSSLSDVPPVIATPHHFLISIYRCNIFLVAVITSEGTLCSHCLDWLICEALNLLDLLALKSNNFGSRNWPLIIFLVVSFLLILLRSLYVKKLLLEFGTHLPRIQMRRYTFTLQILAALWWIFSWSRDSNPQPSCDLCLLSWALPFHLSNQSLPQLVANTLGKL